MEEALAFDELGIERTLPLVWRQILSLESCLMWPMKDKVQA